MKRSVAIILVVLLAFVVTYLVATNFVVASSFSDHITTMNYRGERYHVIPESTLDNDVTLIMDKKGTRHYILSEKKLRLLGPKLLGRR